MARTRFLLPALLLALFFVGLGSIPLLEPDEGRYSVIPQAMLHSGDWVTPRLNGVLYFEKPPLCYWINASSMALFGFGEWQVRLGSALFGLLGTLLAWLLGRSGGERAGLASASILATAPLYIVLAHINTLDTVFSGTVGLALACFWMAREAVEGRTAKLWWYGAFASGALAVLAKGLAGIVLPGGAVFLYLLLSGEWKLLRRVPWVTATLLFLAVVLPWHILAAARNQEWAQFYIVREHFLRFTTTVHARTQPWWFFGPVLLGGFLPWSGLLPAAGAAFARPWRRVREESSLDLFLASWALFPVLFFSPSGSKLIPYVLPSFLPLAVLAGRALAKALEGGPEARLVRAGLLGGGLAPALLGLPFLLASVGRMERFSDPGAFFPLLFALSSTMILAGVGAVVLAARQRLGRSFGALVLASALGFGCVWAAAPRAAEDRSSKHFAEVLRDRLEPGDGLFAYDYYPQTLTAYLGRPMGVVGAVGELEFGVSKLSPAERVLRFPTVAQFEAVWESDRRVYLLATRRHAEAKMPEKGLAPGREIARQGRFVLLVNH